VIDGRTKTSVVDVAKKTKMSLMPAELPQANQHLVMMKEIDFVTENG